MAKRKRGKPWTPDDPRRRGLANLKPAKPGQVLNPTGRNGSEYLQAFRAFFSRPMKAGEGEFERIELVRRALLSSALRGNTRSIQIIVEQLQGRPRQAVELSGPNGGPIPSDDGRRRTSAELRRDLAKMLAGGDSDPEPKTPDESKSGDDDGAPDSD